MDFAQFTWTIVPLLSVLVVIGHAAIVIICAALAYEFIRTYAFPS